MPIITLLTDYGIKDSYVAEMKGAILGILPGATLVDVSHDVGNYSVACLRARFLVDQAGKAAKEPANGTMSVPLTAWRDPKVFDPQHDCICPNVPPGSCGR